MEQPTNPAEQLQSIMRNLYNWCVNNNVGYIDVCLFPNKEDDLKGLASYSFNDATKINDIEFRVNTEEQGQCEKI